MEDFLLQNSALCWTEIFLHLEALFIVVNGYLFLPKKMNIFIWRLIRKGIPTRANLCNLGLVNVSEMCSFGEASEEDIDHVFTSCRFTTPLSRGFLNWWNAVSSASFLAGTAEINMVCLASRYVLLWLIWQWRNKIVHDPGDGRSSILKEDILAEARILSYLWISSRI
ncbi:uncharacterized protein [Rutidosis leptorrhynchoides]|uniref:uncharacterized protein n=1 Tax=Rutidosis leptorrhynchoides TaxID=125765 RepID=UPI003A9A5429